MSYPRNHFRDFWWRSRGYRSRARLIRGRLLRFYQTSRSPCLSVSILAEPSDCRCRPIPPLCWKTPSPVWRRLLDHTKLVMQGFPVGCHGSSPDFPALGKIKGAAEVRTQHTGEWVQYHAININKENQTRYMLTENKRENAPVKGLLSTLLNLTLSKGSSCQLYRPILCFSATDFGGVSYNIQNVVRQWLMPDALRPMLSSSSSQPCCPHPTCTPIAQPNHPRLPCLRVCPHSASFC